MQVHLTAATSFRTNKHKVHVEVCQYMRFVHLLYTAFQTTKITVSGQSALISQLIFCAMKPAAFVSSAHTYVGKSQAQILK